MIKCLKTKLGEDLIGEVTTNSLGEYVIEKPCTVVMMPTGNGGINVGLVPYLPFADKNGFTFPNEYIFFEYEPALDLRNEYTRVVSGIVVANQVPKLSLIN